MLAVLLVVVQLTSLWRIENFASVCSWGHNMLRSVIPLIILCLLNYFIVQALWRSTRRHALNRHRITRMLIAVIVVFIVCVTPDAIMSTVFGFGYSEDNYLVRGVREITDLLLTVNSASNFVLYCFFNSVFRKRFKALIVTGCRRFHSVPPPMNKLLTAHRYKIGRSSGEFESAGPVRGSLVVGSRSVTPSSRTVEINARRSSSVLVEDRKGGGIELKCLESEDGKSTHQLLWNTRIIRR